MRKLTTAVVITAAVLTTPIQPAASEIMSKDMINREIIGKTLTGTRKGMTVRLLYRTDGTVQMKAFVISGSGTWNYSNDGVCMNMTSGPKKGETCVTFEHLGGNKYRNSKGMILTIQ
ncbi:MAG: hypothetical protein COB40_10145 [Marinosulfonomonas sp.]|nr:MAG: hypothetical protein COB40_10145 [Marinosulfonomonas sp.]